ncbi:MAG: hypothetical protein ACLQAH_07500 [Limisphaerales bacterium]
MKDRPDQSTLESDRIANELRLVKAYWLKTIWPYIAKRHLQGVEFYMAADAHRRLQAAQRRAEDWNRTSNGKRCPVPAEAGADLTEARFHEPEELCRDENLKPETLAKIAAPLVQPRPENLTPSAAIGVAHDSLLSAEQYIKALPEQKHGADRFAEDLGWAVSPVTFAQIEASNGKGSGQLPLLPPVARKQKGRTDRDEPLSGNAIKKAVERFLNGHALRLTQKEYERDPAKTESGRPKTYHEWQKDNKRRIEDCLQNNWISLQDLCTLRSERFCRQSQSRSQTAATREQKKRAHKPKKRNSDR